MLMALRKPGSVTCSTQMRWFERRVGTTFGLGKVELYAEDHC